MFQKRGQEGVTLTTLILIIIGAVVAVVIILGATGVLKKIFEPGEAIPQNLQFITEACILDAKQTFISDYCYTFKEVDDNQYINCQDERVEFSLKNQSIDLLSCDDKLVDAAILDVCNGDGVSESTRAKLEFNGGLTCDTVFTRVTPKKEVL